MKTIHRSRPALAALLTTALLGAHFACGGAETTEETLSEAREEVAAESADPAEEPGDVELLKRAEGTFELSLAGVLEEELTGAAVCTRAAGADELLVSMQTVPPGELRYGLAVALDGADRQHGADFEISGPRRWGGPVEVDGLPVTAEPDEEPLDLTFEGTYTGPTGGGTVQGKVHCPPLNRGESTA